MDKKKPNEFIEFIKMLITSFIIVFLLTTFIFKPVRVEGNSMLPNLHDESIGISNIIGLKLSGLERFDIVTIYIDYKDEYLVKRIIGLPNETVQIVDGRVYINNNLLEDDVIDEVMNDAGLFSEPITLAEDEYFVLGDNRNNSSDSRFYGVFKKNAIKSKDIFVLFPFKYFGLAD